jgi:ubiquitin C-terminal hydrolase
MEHPTFTTFDGQDVRLWSVLIPVEFHFEELDRDYRPSAAVCVRGSAAYDSHSSTIARSESNDWYLYDDARIRDIGGVDYVQEVTDNIHFSAFEQL